MRTLSVGSAVILWFVGSLAAITQGQGQGVPQLTASQAQEHAGEIARVCGQVVSYSCSRETGTSLQLFTADDSSFAFLIPYAARANFGRHPEDQFLQRIICATGPIARANRGHLIAVGSPGVLTMSAKPPGLPPFHTEAHRPCEPGVELPRSTKEVKPRYTERAMRDRAEGTVFLQVLVGINGRAEDWRVVRPLHEDLDVTAAEAVRDWQFEPAMFRGEPVPVVVTLEMTFILGDRK